VNVTKGVTFELSSESVTVRPPHGFLFTGCSRADLRPDVVAPGTTSASRVAVSGLDPVQDALVSRWLRCVDRLGQGSHAGDCGAWDEDGGRKAHGLH